MSSSSERSRRIRDEARSRPDKVWLENGKWVEKKYTDPKTSSNEVLSGGTNLAKLITEVDTHLVAMRKTVR